jgi:hypothetical protein
MHQHPVGQKKDQSQKNLKFHNLTYSEPYYQGDWD